MGSPRSRLHGAVPVAVLLGFVLSTAPAGAATVVGSGSTFEITYSDSPGQGFRSESDPVGGQIGNTGETLGEQRRQAFEAAVRIWADLMASPVTVRVTVSMESLACNAGGGTLGFAGFNSVHRDWTTGTLPPRANTFYAQPLANSLAEVDLAPGIDDIDVVLNRDLDDSTCLGATSWYYGLDQMPGSDIDLMTVTLHELGHGLGFVTIVNLSSGTKGNGRDDAYMAFLEDHSTGLSWPDMTNFERRQSATDTGDLHWTGAEIVAASGSLSAGAHASGHVEMYAPNPLERGSSVSHFSNTLDPDELMEPFFSGADHDVGLAQELFVDMGWVIACGNGVVDPGEECDPESASPPAGCTTSCTICGNGTTTAPEECDDGNTVETDACRNDCRFNICGDTVQNVGVEECDDGNLDPFDGCTNGCTVCGNGTTTAPEDCDDGNLLNGDGCPSSCNLGQNPVVDYAPPPDSTTDRISFACQRQAARQALVFHVRKLLFMRRCLDRIQAVKMLAAAGFDTTRAQTVAERVCVEPRASAPNRFTMLGRIEQSRNRAIGRTELRCGTPGDFTINGREIGSSASGDFTRAEIRAHMVRVGCEAEAQIANGYNEAADDLDDFTARDSQGAQPLDTYFPCLSIPTPGDLPTPIDYTPSGDRPDTSSFACQRFVGALGTIFARAKKAILQRCLDRIQILKTFEAASLDTTRAEEAARIVCAEPGASVPDERTMIGIIERLRDRMVSVLQRVCDTPGDTTINGRPVGARASDDYDQPEIEAYVDGVGCAVEEQLGLAYNGAAGDLARFDRRASQGGGTLDEAFPGIVPGNCP